MTRPEPRVSVREFLAQLSNEYLLECAIAALAPAAPAAPVQTPVQAGAFLRRQAE